MNCCVPSCINNLGRNTKSAEVTFHAFPKNEIYQLAWTKALGLSHCWLTKDGLAVCSDHFRSEDFYLTKCGMKKVKSCAVPVLDQDLDAPATLRTCRICLSLDSKMYSMKEHKLDLVYADITGVPVTPDDNLPQKLCWECAHRLQSCAGFKSKAMLSQCLMQDVLTRAHYLTIGDIKSLSLSRPEFQSPLFVKHLDPDNFESIVEDDLIFVKEEQGEDMKEEVAPITEVEIKDEHSNSEIFVEEFLDFDESDDNKTLSEVVTNSKDKNKVKKMKKKKLKENKVEKKVKKKEKKEKNEEEKMEEDDPNTTMDKYKKTDVRRRRTQDCLDETLFTITTMTYDEQIAEIEKRKDSTNYRTAPYKCDVCYRGFMIKDRYTAHIVRHSEACGAYECFICKTRLRSGRALRKHLTAQHTEKFSCKGCPFVTRNRGVAREHERWHAGTKYQCPHCPSQFDKVTTYMGHIRIKHVSDFVCELCGYTFVSQKGILVHKKKKHRLDQEVPLSGPFCETCKVQFKCEEAHERHLKLSSRHSSDNDPNRIRNDSQSMNVERIGRVMRKLERRPVIHPRDPNNKDPSRPEPSGPVTCEQCGIQLRDLRLYAQHFRRAHPDKNRTKYPAMKTPCMCEQCGRIFQSTVLLLDHMWVHTGEKRFKCDRCDKSFTQKTKLILHCDTRSMALLKDHMWVHTGEKRFKCDRCDKSFTQKTNLVFHMRVHSNARPTYECPLCGKHFAFFNNRRRHMFIHTGLKPYKCETCGKCFTTQGEQRAHVEHVHMKKPWPKRVRGHRQSLPTSGDIDHQGWDKGQVED